MIGRRSIVAALAGIFLAGTAAAGQEVPSVLDGADPDMIAAEGQYWIYPTGGRALFAWHSADLKHWEKGAQLLAQDAISWIGDDHAPRHALWAPHMIAAGGRYYLYYSVGPQNPTPSRIGVAVCDGPAGPCADSGAALVADGGHGFEAIDPAVFIDPATGKAYLYAGGSAGATLRAWVLAPDMIHIDHEVKVATPRHFTEGVFMSERRGVYYLSYSSGGWRTSGYSVHYAMATSPTGPWHYAGAILVSDAKYKGPGHHAFLRDPRDGRWYISYHRWEGQTGEGPYDGQRRVAIQPIQFDAAGRIRPIRME
jgi:beta-xylosidase